MRNGIRDWGFGLVGKLKRRKEGRKAGGSVASAGSSRLRLEDSPLQGQRQRLVT
jgi:hypothetical protein